MLRYRARVWLGTVVLAMLCCAVAGAQTSPLPSALPNAPVPAVHGTITGVVKDVSGVEVGGAKVRLVTSVSSDRVVTSEASGGFRFEAVPPGPFSLIVTVEGLQELTVSGRMKDGEVVQAPAIALKIATANQTVTAVSSHELAEMEIKQEEQQRVLAIVPNYFVSYNWKAQPLDTKQKFELSWRATLDPTHFVFALIPAGIEQARGTYPGFGCCAPGFGERYGALLATQATGTMLRGFVMPAVFHQDPRYFYKGTGTVKARFFYALSTAVIERGNNGHNQISSGILADFGAGAISNLYHAPSDRHGAALTFENGALTMLGVGVGHVMQEFVFKRATPSVRQAQVSGARD